MMRIHIRRVMRIHIRPSLGHRTLEIVTSRWMVHAWFHPFTRGWLFRDKGMLCCGVAWISFNVYHLKG